MNSSNTGEREKWNKIYASIGYPEALPEPCTVLKRYSHLLPATGSALDVACGHGGNALYLAEAGLATTAVDISDNAIVTLLALANDKGVELNAVAAAAEGWLSALDDAVCFDVIVVSRFLDRQLIPALIGRLNEGGLVYYQTFVKDKTLLSVGPSNPDYLLDPNELLELFYGWRIRSFYDPGTIGSQDNGLRNESYIVAEKTVNS